MSIKSKIRTIPDFPHKGIMFRDVTTLIKDREGFSEVIDKFVERYKNVDFDYVMGIEARGFIIGGALAYALGKGFIPVRKPGKLPQNQYLMSMSLSMAKGLWRSMLMLLKKEIRFF